MVVQDGRAVKLEGGGEEGVGGGVGEGLKLKSEPIGSQVFYEVKLANTPKNFEEGQIKS